MCMFRLKESRETRFLNREAVSPIPIDVSIIPQASAPKIPSATSAADPSAFDADAADPSAAIDSRLPHPIGSRRNRNLTSKKSPKNNHGCEPGEAATPVEGCSNIAIGMV